MNTNAAKIVANNASSANVRRIIMPRWTEEQKQLLIEHYPKGSIKEIEEMLGRSWTTIQCTANLMGIRRVLRERKKTTGRVDAWTPEEIEIIKKHYVKSTKEEIKKMLPNRTYHAIQNRASENGISKIPGLDTKKLTKIIDEKPGRRQTWIEFLSTVKKLDKLTNNKEKAVITAMEHVRGHRFGIR